MNIKNTLVAYASGIASEFRNGWRPIGTPAHISAFGEQGYSNSSIYPAVSAHAALNLSAVMACVCLRAETIAAMPLHIRDKKKKVAVDHDLYYMLHDSPNASQTNVEYTSNDVMKTDLHGNSYSEIKRRRDKSVISLQPIDPSLDVQFKGIGTARKLLINGEEYAQESILHQKGASYDGHLGLSRLAVGRAILSSQIMANDTAARNFKNSLKIGGFLKTPVNSQPMNSTQYRDFQNRMLDFNDPNNQSRWMPLPPGFEPLEGAKYRLSMADAELMASRYFGIEEICRLFNVPPPLIGHTDKASSWASSVEALNMHFLMYSLQPTLIRREKRYLMQLFSPEERRLYEPRYTAEGLLRVDSKSRRELYASGLQNGWLNINEVRDMEDRISIGAYGDEYRVQLNMANSKEKENENGT